MKFNRVHVQVLLEALIPLLGFFVWGWGLYFILLFYFLDMISDEFILHLKSSKIIKFQGLGHQDWIVKGLQSLLLVGLGFVFIHLSVSLIFPEINFWDEVILFWTYEEMGIEQGYLFVPLVFLLGYQQYKMEFLRPKVFELVDLSAIWKPRLIALLTTTIFAGIVYAASQFIIFSELVYVLGIVVLTSFYKLFFR